MTQAFKKHELFAENQANVLDEFYIYNNINETKYFPNNKFYLTKLPSLLLCAEDYIRDGKMMDKTNVPVFALNTLKTNYRIAANYQSANVCYVDIDFKTEKQIEDFKKQYKNYDDTISFEENVEKFKKDLSLYAWITATSYSGKGVRAIYYIVNKLNNDIINTILSSDQFTAQDIHKTNVEFIYELIEENTGVKQNDNSPSNINLTTTPCRRKNSIVTNNIIEKKLKFSVKLNKFETKNVEDVIVENTKIVKEYNINKLNELNNLDLHYDDILPILSCLQVIQDEDIRTMFYNFLKRNYSGTAFNRNLKTLNNFTNYLNNLKFTKFNVPLKNVLERYNIFSKKQLEDFETKDIFGNKFDEIIIFDDYISNLNFDAEKVVINAPTGAGKTTAALKYLNGLEGIKIFVAPTNFILEQTIKNCEKNKFDYITFYGNNKNEIVDDNILIITNYQNLSLLSGLTAECIIYDEVHKITDYAIFDKNNKPILYPRSKKHVYMSATPEHFMVNISDAKYIKYKHKNFKKRDIKIIYFKSKKTMLKDVHNFFVAKKDNINILFNNDKNINFNIHKNLYENGVDIELIDAANKNEQYYNVVDNDTISKSIITTSLMNEGINITNTVDNIIVIDNNTQSIFDVYQFLNRTRTCEPTIYIFRMLFNNEDNNLRNKNLTNIIQNTFERQFNKVKGDIETINNNINDKIEIKIGEDLFVDYSDQMKDNILINYCYNDNGLYKINENLLKYSIFNFLKNKINSCYQDYIYYMGFFFNIIDVKTRDKIETSGALLNNKKSVKDFVLNYYDKWALDNKLKIEDLDEKEAEFFIQNKNNIIIYMKRIKSIKRFKNYDIDKVFQNFKIFNNYIKHLQIIYIKDQDVLSKLDNEVKNDAYKIDSIINIGMDLDDFIEKYKSIDLLESNKFNMANNKTINKHLKMFGYQLKRVRNDKYSFKYTIIK